jgi:hypothetical protein
MGKVLEFTNKKAEREEEEFYQSIEDASLLVEFMGDAFQDALEDSGYTEWDEKLAQDYFLFLESVRSLAYRYIGIEHPFQTVAERMVDVWWDDTHESWAVDWLEKELDSEEDI